jgi:putative tricarboxylic transport membrane protein
MQAADPSTVSSERWPQFAIAVGVLAVAAMLAVGAAGIPGEAGYAGVGPNFLPWVMAAALATCGVWLLALAWRGGWPDMEAPSGAERGDWRALAWVVGGIVANAALITRIGFVLSCALCFVLAVRGLRLAEGRPAGGPARLGADAAIGLAIALPVYWLFARGLAINLPALTSTGWL